MNVNGRILGIIAVLILLPSVFAGIQVQSRVTYNYNSPLAATKALPFTVKLLCVGNSVYKDYYYTDGTRSRHFVKSCPSNTFCANGFCVEKPKQINICNLIISWNCQKTPMLLGRPYCKNGNLWQLYQDPEGRRYGIQIHNCFSGCANGYCLAEPVQSRQTMRYRAPVTTPTVKSRRYYCVGKQVWVEEHYCNNTVKRRYVMTCGIGDICYGGACIKYGGTIQNDVDSIPKKTAQNQQTYARPYTGQARCTAGWVCKDSKRAAYRYSNCNWGNTIYCQNGCSNGVCVNIIGNNNRVTVNNRVNITYNYTYNYYYQRRYQQPSQYQGIRTQTLYREGWFCKDYYHKAYRTADGRWISVQYCPKGCVNGYCVMTSSFDPKRDP